MIRRAEWRPRPGDGRRVWSVRIALLVVLGLPGVTLLGLGNEAFAAFVGLVGSLLVLVPRRPRLQPLPSEPLRSSAPWPLAPGTFPVRVTYYREIDFVDEDEAMVSFGDGWMTVEGLRASFSLRPGDAHVLHSRGNGCDLFFREDDGRIELRPFDALIVGGERRDSLRNRFEIALDRWLDGEGVEGFPIMPPRWSLRRSSAHRTLVLGYVGSGLAIFGFAMLVGTAPPGLSTPVYAVMLGAGLGTFMVTFARLRRHFAYRTRLPLPLKRPFFDDV